MQVRVQGFSFNRLAPYTSLDDYLPAIERAWRLFLDIASPAEIRRVRLRYINRILLPLVDGRVVMKDYLKVGPRLPDEKALLLTGFLNQTVALDAENRNEVKIILANQAPQEGHLPVILDLTVTRQESAMPDNWDWILAQVHSLRALKNRVFVESLTKKCLELFR